MKKRTKSQREPLTLVNRKQAAYWGGVSRLFLDKPELWTVSVSCNPGCNMGWDYKLICGQMVVRYDARRAMYAACHGRTFSCAVADPNKAVMAVLSEILLAAVLQARGASESFRDLDLKLARGWVWAGMSLLQASSNYCQEVADGK
jgi:hypothetical protein